MTTIASQITSLTVVYSIVYSDAVQRKQSSASLAFVWGIQRDRWIPRTKGQLRGKCFHLMTSSWTTCICLAPSVLRASVIPFTHSPVPASNVQTLKSIIHAMRLVFQVCFKEQLSMVQSVSRPLTNVCTQSMHMYVYWVSGTARTVNDRLKRCHSILTMNDVNIQMTLFYHSLYAIQNINHCLFECFWIFL